MEDNGWIQQAIGRLTALKQGLDSAVVRIAFMGETGSGKSSLVNDIVGWKVLQVGATGETTTIPWEVRSHEFNGLVFVDLPGCGTPRWPRETYVERLRLLTDYDAFVLVTDKRVRQGDEWLFARLSREAGKPVFVVRTHFDLVVQEEDEAEARRKIEADVRWQLGAGPFLRVYLTAAKGPCRYDLPELIAAIRGCLAGWKQVRFTLAAAAYTEEMLAHKRREVERLVAIYAGLAALNGLNPVPGLDVAADLALLTGMANEVVSAFGLRPEQLDYAGRRTLTAGAIQVGKQVGRITGEYLGRDAVQASLRRMGARVAGTSLAKWIPVVGPAVAALAGYKLASAFGGRLIDDCEAAARQLIPVLVRA